MDVWVEFRNAYKWQAELLARKFFPSTDEDNAPIEGNLESIELPMMPPSPSVASSTGSTLFSSISSTYSSVPTSSSGSSTPLSPLSSMTDGLPACDAGLLTQVYLPRHRLRRTLRSRWKGATLAKNDDLTIRDPVSSRCKAVSVGVVLCADRTDRPFRIDFCRDGRDLKGQRRSFRKRYALGHRVRKAYMLTDPFTMQLHRRCISTALPLTDGVVRDATDEERDATDAGRDATDGGRFGTRGVVTSVVCVLRVNTLGASSTLSACGFFTARHRHQQRTETGAETHKAFPLVACPLLRADAPLHLPRARRCRVLRGPRDCAHAGHDDGRARAARGGGGGRTVRYPWRLWAWKRPASAVT